MTTKQRMRGRHRAYVGNNNSCSRDLREIMTRLTKLVDIVRFMEKVGDPNDNGCWPWCGSLVGLDRIAGGTGSFRWKSKSQAAHRASYEIFKGPIGENLSVCHTCDVPSCVNPDHLFLGTQKDNNMDKAKKGRAKRTDLNEAAIRKIRSDPRLQREIAADHGIAQVTVSAIKCRKIWAWVK